MVEKKSGSSKRLAAVTVAEPQTHAASAGSSATIQPHQQQHMYSEAAMRNNYGILEYCRTCQAAASGMVSGILGLSGTMGFVFYFLFILFQAFVWEYKSGFQWGTYFPGRWTVVLHSLVGGLFTYVLFWVFIYGMVHVY